MGSRHLEKIFYFIIMVMMILSLTACSENREIIHYADAESFEAALNKGEKLEGKIVRFVAGELKPDSAFGYNIWAGEHLNFVSSRDPGIKEGDTVAVKATAIEYVSGSWIIRYEKVDHAVLDDSTISLDHAAVSASPDGSGDGAGADSTNASDREETTDSEEGSGDGASADLTNTSGSAETTDSEEGSEDGSTADLTNASAPEETSASTDTSEAAETAGLTDESDPAEIHVSTDGSGHAAMDGSAASSEKADSGSTSGSAEQPLELVDSGWCISSQSGDIVYIDFCEMIYNPNKDVIASFPTAIATVRHSDGHILATKEQMGSIVMPGDTITLCSFLSIPASGVTDDMQIIFDVDWVEWEHSTSTHSAVKTTDFAITNVSESSSKDQSFVTGEITNHYSEDINKVYLSMILRKDGEIVYIDDTYLDRLRSGKTKAFQFWRYDEWPEHDTIDISALVWSG